MKFIISLVLLLPFTLAAQTQNPRESTRSEVTREKMQENPRNPAFVESFGNIENDSSKELQNAKELRDDQEKTKEP